MAQKYPKQRRDNATYQTKRAKALTQKQKWEKAKPGPKKLAAFHDWKVAQDDFNAYALATR